MLRAVFKTALPEAKCTDDAAPTYPQELCVSVKMPEIHIYDCMSMVCIEWAYSAAKTSGSGIKWTAEFAVCGPAMWNSLPPALHDNIFPTNMLKQK